jgi:hypothetical protein
MLTFEQKEQLAAMPAKHKHLQGPELAGNIPRVSSDL